MSNPLDTYLGEREKVAVRDYLGAASKGLGKAFNPTVIGTVLGTAALSAALDIPGEIGRKAYYAVTKTRDFNKMMETDPTLNQYNQANTKQFHAHYNSLRSMNPQFAADPIVAGTYMRMMAQSPSTAGSVIVDSLGGIPRPSQPTLGARDIYGMTDQDLNPVQKALWEAQTGSAKAQAGATGKPLPLNALQQEQLSSMKGRGALELKKLRGEVKGMPAKAEHQDTQRRLFQEQIYKSQWEQGRR